MTRLPLLSLLAAAGAFGVWLAQPAPTGLPPMAASAQGAAEVDISGVREMALGAEDAPVTVIEYASFTCPHCADFHADVLPRLKADYIDTGKIRFISREVYFDRFGLWAAMVARCDGGDRYFGIADMIYDRQRTWTRGEPQQVVEALAAIGVAAGLSRETLQACLSDGDKAQALVAWYRQNATADGIEATPSFVIEGERFSNMPYDDFREVLDARLGG